MRRLFWFIVRMANQEQLERIKIMAAIDMLNSNVVALTAAVDAVVTYDKTGATEAQVQAASDAVAAQAGRLVSVVNPAAPPAPTA